jgi:hypothetical protein
MQIYNFKIKYKLADGLARYTGAQIVIYFV